MVYKPERIHLQADHLSRIFEEKTTDRGIDDEFPDAALFAVYSDTEPGVLQSCCGFVQDRTP